MWHGCTHIAGKYPLRTVEQDYLTYGAGLVKGLGFDTIKLELSTAYSSLKYINQAFGSPATLAQLAAEPAFSDVFDDPAFTRYMLTSFSLADPLNNPWAGDWNDSRGDLQESEFYDYCVELLSHSGKEFILSNWEGDWQLLNSFNPDSPIPNNRVQAYRDYHRRRQRAMRKAVADTVSSSTLIYCVEANRVLDGWGRRVHRDIVSAVQPDMVSLSCYEAIEGWLQGLSQVAFESDIEAKLTEIVRRVRKYTSAPIILGEYGWPIDDPWFVSQSYDVAALWAKVISAADSLGIVGEIPWQILDNEEQSPGVPRGFAMYNRNANSNVVGSRNASGDFFFSYL
jgi:hypothetical protein